MRRIDTSFQLSIYGSRLTCLKNVSTFHIQLHFIENNCLQIKIVNNFVTK